jgi:hypothetical protein
MMYQVWRVAGRDVEVCQRGGPLAATAIDMDDRVESNEGDGQIRGVGRDAVLARAQDGVHAMESLQGATAGAGFTLVACAGGITKIAAARALEQIPLALFVYVLPKFVSAADRDRSPPCADAEVT